MRRRFAGEGDDIGGRCRIVVADVVDRAGLGLCHGRTQHLRDIHDMNAREDLARLDDPLRAAGAHGIESIAAGPINPGEAEDVHGQAVASLQIQPLRLRGDPATPALACRQQRRILVHPAARPVAIDAGGRGDSRSTAARGRRRSLRRWRSSTGSPSSSGGTELRRCVAPARSARASASGCARSKRRISIPSAVIASRGSAARPVPSTRHPSVRSARERKPAV